MSKAGKRLIEGAKEALAIAKGEQPAASITISGHRYVPESRALAAEAKAVELEIDVKSYKMDAEQVRLERYEAESKVERLEMALRGMLANPDKASRAEAARALQEQIDGK